MNRDKYLTYVLIAGVVFLVFYWTNSYFSKAIIQADTDYQDAKDKTEKAVSLYIRSMSTAGEKPRVTNGLMTFVEDTAKGIGVGDRLGDIKPKSSAQGEAVSFHIDSLTNNEVVEFLRLMESHSNISMTNIKITKRFDNEKRLNLYVEASKL